MSRRQHVEVSGEQVEIAIVAIQPSSPCRNRSGRPDPLRRRSILMPSTVICGSGA
jgi:hypothetical protein